jgi:DUF4097 and DUF4098 domain-containing protein YvlB
MRATRSLLVPLVLALAAAPALATPATRTVEHSIPARGKVVIANLAGTIDLVPTAEGPVKVVAVVHAEGDSPSETRRLIDAMRWVQEPNGTWNLAYPVDDYDAFTYLDDVHSFGGSSTVRFRGERVRIYGKPRLWSGGDAPVLFADITVSVPRGVELQVINTVGPVRGRSLAAAKLVVDTGSGNIKLAGVEGELVADTGSGDVEISDVAGDTVLADTGSGDVKIDQVTARELKVDTGSGDIWVAHGRVGHMLADTGSGDIEVQEVEMETFVGDTGSGDVVVRGGLAAATRIAVDTGSGEVRLLGGEGFEFDLDADTGSGDVRVGYQDADVRRSRDEVTGARRGSGRTRITVGTGSGDVVVAPLDGR